ncbi:hypothetical protein EMIHUDRAFT_259120 [Emiliania huxleyi CCMP1516]|uniref:ATP-dependent RNA helicase Ski2/MTR4 C-terminal domain-containing protein n=2 Tax=Emiliania huxleyi TaxID=2903 RepID=A0A0D3I433_EMIH1|nr:hypothetical protein EMIHUDRAFT_259120 [Emiliania huxleyi CCMP1516]EOD06018.1 hypothetical protein EMIHUDRAFT_259120 [Emiliania huxleyi CCMP1516]|eukprot:XP_005758447.1 hypothetical protein EMIHUDRAFT_259120 [Emiliania huxleyi CCMP1516]
MRRLEELLHQIIDAAKVVGNEELQAKCEAAQKLLVRDVRKAKGQMLCTRETGASDVVLVGAQEGAPGLGLCAVARRAESFLTWLVEGDGF